MLSRRLWRSINEADLSDPIFRRVSQAGAIQPGVVGKFRLPRPALFAAALLLAGMIAASPSLLILVFAAPIVMITLMVATPVLLPVYAWTAGLQVTAAVISGIYREKHQFTYELLCAAPRGPLSAGWALAAGIAHGFEWFAPLRWGTRFCLLGGLGFLAGLGILALLLAVTGGQAFGLEQARLLLLIGLLLALYYCNLTQTLALSLAAGLLASSFDLARQDALVAGIFVYVMLSLLPVVAGVAALAVLGEAAGFVAVIGLRELGVWLAWRGVGVASRSR